MTISRTIVLMLSLATVTAVLANNFRHKPERTDTYDHAIAIQAGAEVLDIIDGDTIRVKVYMWPKHQWTGLIRLRGIDTPELRGSQCQSEKDQGILARNTLQSLIPPRVLLLNITEGKFAGRYVAKVMDGDYDLANILMENGVGRPYFKGKRKTWCNESAESIKERHKRMKPSHQPTPPPQRSQKSTWTI